MATKRGRSDGTRTKATATTAMTMTKTTTKTTTTTTTKTAVVSATDAPTKRLHLLSDPGFLRNYWTNLLAMVVISGLGSSVPLFRYAAIETWFWVQERMMDTAHYYAWWSLLGLLSSSCCALQLLLNAVSFGCAGFNTWLGPIRPTMLAFTTLVQASSWVVAWNKQVVQSWMPTLVSTVVVVSLAVLPEALEWFRSIDSKAQSQGFRQRRRTQQQQQETIPDIGNRIKDELVVKPTKTCRYRLDNIGCSACVTTVSNVLEGIDTVENFEISLEHGGSLSVTTTTIITSRGVVVDNSQAVVRSKLEQAGFPIQPL